jgi:predicted permease
MTSLVQDLRYGVRHLARTPGFTAIAVLTLAVGIAANTALFAFTDAVFLHPVPGASPVERLVWLAPYNTREGFGTVMSYPDFLDYRDSSGAFESAAAYGNVEVAISGGDQPVRARGQLVSGTYFSLLGAHMALGRGLGPDDDRNRSPVAVISHHIWEERFQSDSAVLGRTIVLDGLPFTLIGVAADGFNGADLDERRRDVWLPLSMQPRIEPRFRLESRGTWWLSAFGRLKPEVPVSRATAAVATVAKRLATIDSVDHQHMSAFVAPMRGGVRPSDMNDVTPVALLAAGATSLILLICCANVSNLLLGRAVGRRREIGVRMSIGASRWRLIRQFLTESLVLAIAASACGFVLALWATDALTHAVLPTLSVVPSGNTFAFAVGIAVVTALVFGVVPALNATRADLSSVLRDSTLGFDRRRSRLQGAFVVAQVSLSLVLLTTSGMFLNGLYRASRVDVAFEATSHVLAASFDLGLQRYTPEQSTAFIQTVERQTAGLPGVTSVSATSLVPLGERRNFASPTLDPGETENSSSLGSRGGEVYDNIVRPDFFKTLGIDLVAGREFSSADGVGAPPVVVVSADFARRAWPSSNPLGKHVSLSGQAGPFLTVIGVARDALTFGVGERLRPIVYRAQAQFAQEARDVTLLVRAVGDAAALAPAIRREIHALDRNLPVYALQTLGKYRRDRLADMAIGSTLLGIIGGLAVLLASIGLCAVIAFSVGQRTREIGIRVALGAAQASVVGRFVREGLVLTAIGVVLGTVLSAVVAKSLSRMFLGVAASDALTFALVATLLVGVALIASWIPARRAARVDPIVALRAE